MVKKVKTQMFVVVEPLWSRNGEGVAGIKAVKACTRKPKLTSNQYMIRMTLEMPASAFDPPEVSISIPEHKIEAPKVKVEYPE